MLIVNPLYDHAFKYLMQNERFAKRILEVILDEEIETLSLSAQETVVPDEKRYLTLFRLDFKAVIKTPDGQGRTVLIELQKSKFETDIVRFRNYLGTNYISSPTKKELSEEIENKDEKKIENSIFPIVTIYFLGYKLNDLPYLAVRVKRKVLNASDGSEIETQSVFVNHLTHESHILQIRRLPEHRRTRLERFLTIFNQTWIADKNYILNLEEIPEEFADIANYLERPILDADFRRRLEAEEEIDTIFNNQEAKYLKQIAEAKAETEEAKKREENAILREKEAKIREQDAQNKIRFMIKRMHEMGQSSAQIAEILGMTTHEIEAFLL